MTPAFMAALGFYAVFVPVFLRFAFHLARPTWRVPPKAPPVITSHEIPRGTRL